MAYGSPHLGRLLLSSITVALGSCSLAVEWSTRSYGPDGPWQAVTVGIGTTEGNETLSTVDLHPGGMWGSFILTSHVCDDIGDNRLTPCPVSVTNMYNPNRSQTSFHDSANDAADYSNWEWHSWVARPESVDYTVGLDTMRMNTSEGMVTASNSPMLRLTTSAFILPEGQTYATSVGHLALGSPGNGTTNYKADPDVLGYTFPGALAANGKISSASVGLHYGSAALKANGSLVWGGYDQSRVLGDVGSFGLANSKGGGYNMIMSLLDIQIGVEVGETPFPPPLSNPFNEPGPSFITGLLALDNTTSGSVQPTNLNPLLNYMYMDAKTCAAIAKLLPVKLQTFTNLYTWNTGDSLYEQIVSSSAYLAFVFENLGQGNLTIKVPFRLLNLTLDTPIVTSPVQYFPCHPFEARDGSGHFFLGKAFLQAAFLGLNWEQKKFFLAQAPGPGAAAPNLQDIAKDATSINSDPIDGFASSWSNSWTPIAKSSGSDGSSGNETSDDSTNNGLSKGAKAGIAVGIVVFVLAITGLLAYLFVRRRRSRHGTPVDNGQSMPEKDSQPVLAATEKDGQPSRPELSKDGQRHEVAGQSLHEAGDGIPLHEVDTH